MPRRSKWTEEEWELMAAEIRRLYAKPKATHRLVAKQMRCSEQNVRNILYGIKPKYFKKG